MANQSYREVVSKLKRSNLQVRELSGPGCVAVAPYGGRIISIAFTEDGENLFWSNPALNSPEPISVEWDGLVGGLGGDRLWFGPEYRFHWRGAPDWDFFSNYSVPKAVDPGNYSFKEETATSIDLRAEIEILDQVAGRPVNISVEKSVSFVACPLSRDHPMMANVDYVGVETVHILTLKSGIEEGRVDLWHILQLPIGTTLVVPIRHGAELGNVQPLVYGQQGSWIQKVDHVLWRFTGNEYAKFGMSVRALNGRCAALRPMDNGQWCLIVREFPVASEAEYGDHPFGQERDDQVFQAWDGFGFGEMEYHSPVLDAKRGPCEVHDRDKLWVFGGSIDSIATIAESLTGIDVRPAMEQVSD